MFKFDWRPVAHTTDGYEAAGGSDSCAKTLFAVRKHWHEGRPLTELSTETLRIALFFAARVDRQGLPPTRAPWRKRSSRRLFDVWAKGGWRGS